MVSAIIQMGGIINCARLPLDISFFLGGALISTFSSFL